MQFDQLLRAFEADFGIENLELDEEREISFSSDDVIVTIKEENETFFFVTKLCAATDDLATFKYLLTENDFGVLGGYIGMDQRNNTFVLTTKLPAEGLTAEIAIKRLGTHFASVEHIRQGLQEGILNETVEEGMLALQMHAIRI